MEVSVCLVTGGVNQFWSLGYSGVCQEKVTVFSTIINKKYIGGRYFETILIPVLSKLLPTNFNIYQGSCPWQLYCGVYVMIISYFPLFFYIYLLKIKYKKMLPFSSIYSLNYLLNQDGLRHGYF